MNKDIIEKLFPGAIECIEKGKCPTCGGKIKPDEFKDKLTLKEYRVSGLCSACQHKTFGV